MVCIRAALLCRFQLYNLYCVQILSKQRDTPRYLSIFNVSLTDNIERSDVSVGLGGLVQKSITKPLKDARVMLNNWLKLNLSCAQFIHIINADYLSTFYVCKENYF